MTDRELLEMAAKAAGITIKPVEIKNVEFAGDDRFIGYSTDPHEWLRGWFNPLTDDGDALRLAVKLGIDVEMHGMLVNFPFCCASAKNAEIQCEEEAVHVDDMASVRRAIVRAAAAIGGAM